MTSKDKFISEIQEGYTFKGGSVFMGLSKLNDEILTDARISAPLKMFNRHGLIAGATGTGKTISLQVIAESLSREGVPSLVMDVKGDLSGIAAAGKTHEKVEERNTIMGLPSDYSSNPAEIMTISETEGIPMRATVSEFGPILLSKILGLNDTQSGVLAMLFKYCDDNMLPLLDLNDLRQIVIESNDSLKEELAKLYGSFSSSSTGTILRKVIEIEQQGAGKFFGERSFEVEDFVRTKDGKGVISIFNISDIQDKPKLFSSFMLCLLAEIYNTFPEIGDPDKPKLVIFIDEAHLIFDEASDPLQSQIESTIKLIRSKGVGIFFITQNPADVPESVLGQLGMKVQHALRAFTAKDQKAIKLAAENFPMTDYYDIEDTLTSMGIGEALVTTLNEKGIPTPLSHTYMKPPHSRIGVLSDSELKDLVNSSELKSKYSEVIDRESAFEILQGKLNEEGEDEEETIPKKSSSKKEEEGGIVETVSDVINSPTGKIITRELTRGILGALGLKTTATRRRKKKGLFW